MPSPCRATSISVGTHGWSEGEVAVWGGVPGLTDRDRVVSCPGPIYQQLQRHVRAFQLPEWVATATTTATTTATINTTTAYTPCFDCFRPRKKFKKREANRPDFLVIIVK